MCGLDVKQETDLDSADIYVNIGFIENSIFAAHLSIDIAELAILERTGQFRPTHIWSRDRLFLYGDKTALGKRILEVVREMMDEFTNTYLKANPRQFVDSDIKISTEGKWVLVE